jgi:nitroimidazol reductase NimA-like FMN-containing flavoprotein (pyridoxamine 5'-phosphate oxidase superfamily)
MKKIQIIVCSLCSIVFFIGSCFAQGADWKDGGPKYLYVKPGKITPQHMPYDKDMKCIECHKYDGVDAYTAATITLKKSKTGRLAAGEIKQAIGDALKGNGNYREMYVLSTSFNNKPLATCIEFTLDPKTLAFYASSEKQTEKLFHMAANPHVSMVYVRHRDDKNYFVEPLGVQIVGKAEVLKDGDPGFDEALNISLSTVHLPEGMTLSPELLSTIKKNQLVTKVTPERIIITSAEIRAKGEHFKQIWEAAKK